MGSQEDFKNPPNGQQYIQVSDPQELGDTLSGFQIVENPVQMESPAENSAPSNNANQAVSKSECIPVDKPGETHPGFSIPLVLPDEELECLLLASIELCKKGTVVHMGVCHYQFRGIEISFTKILTDDASWKSMTHDAIRSNCEKLIELCVLKLKEDWLSLLESLAVVFDPQNKFHIHNGEKGSETVSLIPAEKLYAQPTKGKTPKGWLVDFLNRFGSLHGFDILLERFQSNCNLTVPVIHALIRPFGLCIEFLTNHTLIAYLLPIAEITMDILNNLVDEELKNEATSDKILAILKTLIPQIPDQSEMITELNALKMNIILRILQISSHNGKMSAVNEINEIIVNIKSSRISTRKERDRITTENLIQWIKRNGVLEIMLGDSLNQPEFVEKLETILQFIIEERAFTLKDLDTVWTAQDEKHEAIVNNVHDLLTKLARGFSPGQIDYFFERLKTSLIITSNDQDKLLEFIRRLSENNDEVMITKVLALLWDFAHTDEVSTEMMEKALNVHVKILETQNDDQRSIWLDKYAKELLTDGGQWDLPALKQIRKICLLYEKKSDSNDRGKVIKRLKKDNAVAIESLIQYMEKMRKFHNETPNIDPTTFMSDNRYNHNMQVQERLNFIHFFCTGGRYYLSGTYPRKIWKCLAEQGVVLADRDTCFKWFSKYIDDIPYWNETHRHEFYRDHVSQLDPALLTQSGIQCFEKFFVTVNFAEGKLQLDNGIFVVKDVGLLGIEYLWKIVRSSPDAIAERGVELLKQVCIERKLQKCSYHWT